MAERFEYRVVYRRGVPKHYDGLTDARTGKPIKPPTPSERTRRRLFQREAAVERFLAFLRDPPKPELADEYGYRDTRFDDIAPLEMSRLERRIVGEWTPPA